MTSGALRATANSSGACRLREQRAAAERERRAGRGGGGPYACSIILLWRLSFAGVAREGAEQQDDDADANRGVGDIEDQKGPELAEMQVEEVDDIAEAHAVDDIAERAAEHQRQARAGRRALSSRLIHQATPSAIAAVIATSSQRGYRSAAWASPRRSRNSRSR